MVRLKGVFAAAVSAFIMSFVGIAAAFAVHHFLNVSLVVLLCVFMFIVSFVFALSDYFDSESSQKSFTRLRLEKGMSDLFWNHSEAQARVDFFDKVSEEAPDSEIKKSYQALKRALRHLDGEK